MLSKIMSGPIFFLLLGNIGYAAASLNLLVRKIVCFDILLGLKN